MKGFTLIELLIVIAIMGLAGALIVGALSRSLEEKQFMLDCLQHEPQYSCEVKWKQISP
jgi:prepilin-type N-terminal cleavage/methylation domain-containing protein